VFCQSELQPTIVAAGPHSYAYFLNAGPGATPIFSVSGLPNDTEKGVSFYLLFVFSFYFFS